MIQTKRNLIVSPMKGRRRSCLASAGALALASLIAVGCGKSHDKQAAASPLLADNPSAGSRQTESDILNRLHQSNRMEIQLASLAKDRSERQDVRALADRLTSDHEQADARVTDVAKRLNIDLRQVQPLAGPQPSGTQPGSQPSGTQPGSQPSGTQPGSQPSGTQPGSQPSGTQPGSQPSATPSEAERRDRTEMESAFSRLQPLRGQAFDSAFLEMVRSDHQRLIADLTEVRRNLVQSEVGRLIDELLPTLQSHAQTAESLLGTGTSETGPVGKSKKGTPTQMRTGDKKATAPSVG